MLKLNRIIVSWAYKLAKINYNKPSEQKTIIQKIFFNGTLLMLNLLNYSVLNICYRRGRVPIKKLGEGKDVIVSITSFPQRMARFWMVLHSIYMQTELPNKILLILTEEEYPNGLDDVPVSVKRFTDFGLEIVFTKDNLRPHNKYFYAFQNYKNSMIITLDDDQYYWPDTVERLMELHYKYPTAVCANSVFEIVYNDNKVVFKDNYIPETNNRSNFARGVCGVLYPPNFRSPALFDKSAIKKLALGADDLWLKAHELLQSVEVIGGVKYPMPMEVIGSQTFALRNTNVHKDQNSQQWNNLINYYSL